MPDHHDDAAEKSSIPSDTSKTTGNDGDKRQMERRKFIQTAALGAVGLTAEALGPIRAKAGARSTSDASAQHPIPSSVQPKFDHLVVLMMENRSFDHMLGRLYYSENSPPFDKPPRGQAFDGIQPSMSNPVSSAYSWLPAKVGVNRATHYATPPDDNVGHQYRDAEMQIGVKAANGSSMNGFVNNRVLNLGVSKKPPLSAVEAPMLGFSPAEYIADGKGPFAADSVLSTLANNFAVCDNWFSSLPGPTLVNRSFLHAGTSNNWVSNNHNWDQNQNPTVFNLLGEGQWRIYNGDGTTECLTFIIHPTIQWEPGNSIARFCLDASLGALPKYSFIEPEVIGYDNGNPPDDQHPPRDIRLGENLITTVYQAVRSGPLWSRTLMIVIYDEHGGFFDHRFPPAAVPPNPGGPPGEDGFLFNALGVRVPAVLISPYIQSGTIFHPSSPVDHTAVIKTLCKRFGLPSLTNRDAHALDLSQILSSSARTLEDTPELSLWPVPASELGPRPLNDLQRELVALLAEKYHVPLPPLSDTRQAKDFLRSLSGLNRLRL
jgi:phospholipase C